MEIKIVVSGGSEPGTIFGINTENWEWLCRETNSGLEIFPVGKLWHNLKNGYVPHNEVGIYQSWRSEESLGDLIRFFWTNWRSPVLCFTAVYGFLFVEERKQSLIAIAAKASAHSGDYVVMYPHHKGKFGGKVWDETRDGESIATLVKAKLRLLLIPEDTLIVRWSVVSVDGLVGAAARYGYSGFALKPSSFKAMFPHWKERSLEQILSTGLVSQFRVTASEQDLEFLRLALSKAREIGQLDKALEIVVMLKPMPWWSPQRFIEEYVKSVEAVRQLLRELSIDS